jgi:hypothetical protein
MRGRAQRSTKAQPEGGFVLARIAVAVDGPDAGALPQVGLAEDEVPARPRPEVGRRQGHIRQGISGPLRLQDFVQDVPGQHLGGAPGGMRASRPRGDRSQWDVSVDLHRAVEEEGEVVLGEIEDSPLGLVEFANEAEVDRVEPVAPANGLGNQVLGIGLARLMMCGQPVARSRSRQGFGKGSELAFQFQVWVRHGSASVVLRLDPPSLERRDGRAGWHWPGSWRGR